jgi:hypothetical protein
MKTKSDLSWVVSFLKTYLIFCCLASLDRALQVLEQCFVLRTEFWIS